MATKKPAKASGGAASRVKKRPITQYGHPKESRPNNPPVGLVGPENDPPEATKTYAFDPNVDPRLEWAGKAERTSFSVPTVSLHVHERVDPRTILEAVRRRNGDSVAQMALFEQSAMNPPLREAVDFYKHPHGWANRLIAGDSLLVMTSLLEKEGLAGRVQVVYFDPPYGIEYYSNFQPFVGQREVTDHDDDDLTREPETLKAFRDTWDLGVHSYLGYLRDRLLLARELLHTSGSIFVQISDANFHLVRAVMDEVFGNDRFVVTIPIKKKGSQKSKLLAPVNDYLLWYSRSPRARDPKLAEQVFFQPLFVKKEIDSELLSEYRNVELPDGSLHDVKKMPVPEGTRDYLRTPQALFKDFPGARVFRANPLTSGGTRPNQADPIVFGGKTFRPPENNCWKHTTRTDDGSPPGMKRVEWAGRLIAGEGQLRIKSYLDDFEYERLSNWWDGLGGASDPVYVVQTNEEIVKRCILMTSRPGDLVFDPTCGSGTTAVVAERWGRRWMTCDTSRVAITLARQRLMTQAFHYYELAKPDDGPVGGFRLNTVRHLEPGHIANNPDIREGMDRMSLRVAIDRHAGKEALIDDPIKDAGRVRVTGPFTVEAVPAPVVKPLDDIGPPAPPITASEPLAAASLGRDGESLRQSKWRHALVRAGVRARGGQHIRFAWVEPMAGTRHVHADAETLPDATNVTVLRERMTLDRPRRAVIVFGGEHAPLEQRTVSLALEEASHLHPKPAFAVFAAFQFDPEASKDIDETPAAAIGMHILKVQMSPDLLSEDLRQPGKADDVFWLVGQPDVDLRRRPDGTFEVEVRGFDYFDTRKGELRSGGRQNIAMWSLDTDYDGRSLYPRQVFFPLSDEKKAWGRLGAALRNEIDESRLRAYRGHVSLPFTAGDHARVAVKIVDDRGVESLRVMRLGVSEAPR